MATVDKKVSDKLQCVVVTPEKTILDEVADFIALPLYDGELGVMPGRAPLIGRLGHGELRTREMGNTRRFYLDGGFAQVRDNVVTILTNRAIPADQIDATAAAAELERAKARSATTAEDQAIKATALERARALARVAAKRS